MVRKFIRASLFAAFGAVAVALAYGSAAAGQKDDKVPDISEIMIKGHKGTDAYLAKIKGTAKAGNWDDAEKYAKTLAFFGENLGKNKPPKGDAKSWEKLTQAYASSTKAVHKGTQDKDVKAVNKGLGAIGMSCGGCHKAHK